MPDTDIASSIFDGITYAKGAAVLKQLMFLVGENNFSKGLQSYFERFKWSNATIDDFLTDFFFFELFESTDFYFETYFFPGFMYDPELLDFLSDFALNDFFDDCFESTSE